MPTIRVYRATNSAKRATHTDVHTTATSKELDDLLLWLHEDSFVVRADCLRSEDERPLWVFPDGSVDPDMYD